MAYVAKRNDIMLMVLQDYDIEENPRKDWDNFGTMACFHSRYNLGDRYDYKKPEYFLADLVRETVSYDDLVEYINAGHLENVRLRQDVEDECWNIEGYDKTSDTWLCMEYFNGELEDVKGEIADWITDDMNRDELMALANTKNLILPLYLYDHSMLSMSTESFVGKAVHAEWDSGQIGWTYAPHEKIQKEYGELTPETTEEATERLKGEVKIYDSYLRGEAYGFKLFKDGEEKDSCWGFIGGIDDIKDNIAYYLSDENKDMVEGLEYIEENETQMYETEYEQEYAM